MANIQQVSFTAPSELDTERKKIDRARRMGEILGGQAMQPMEAGQMVGKHFVPASPLAGLAKLVQAYGAGKQLEAADKQETELGERSRQMLVDGLQSYQRTLQGTPAETFKVMDDEYGEQTATAPATPGNKQQALAQLLQSGHPMLQQMGVQQMLAKPESPFGKVDPKDFTQESVAKFAQSGNFADLVPARKMEVAPSGVAYNPFSVKEGTVFNDPNKLMSIGADGAPVVNQQLANVKKDIAKSGATNVQVSTEKTYAGNVAEGLAKQDVGAIDAAKSAPERIRTAHMIKDVLKQNPITGSGAEFRLGVEKTLATNGLIDGTRVKNTEDLASLLAAGTLDAIKSSGLGAGQGFTDKDRQFLERAKSGNLELNSGTLSMLADLNERAARASIARGNQVAKRIKSNPSFGSVGQDLEVEMPPEYKEAAPVVPSSPATPATPQGGAKVDYTSLYGIKKK